MSYSPYNHQHQQGSYTYSNPSNYTTSTHSHTISNPTEVRYESSQKGGYTTATRHSHIDDPGFNYGGQTQKVVHGQVSPSYTMKSSYTKAAQPTNSYQTKTSVVRGDGYGHPQSYQGTTYTTIRSSQTGSYSQQPLKYSQSSYNYQQLKPQKETEYSYNAGSNCKTFQLSAPMVSSTSYNNTTGSSVRYSNTHHHQDSYQPSSYQTTTVVRSSQHGSPSSYYPSSTSHYTTQQQGASHYTSDYNTNKQYTSNQYQPYTTTEVRSVANNEYQTTNSTSAPVNKQGYKNVLGNYGYNDDDILGQGSYGKVYKGVNLTTGDFVAVKQMNNDNFIDQQAKESLQNEIQVMKQLNSANVVRIFEVFSTPQYTYLVLELCSDGDLEKLLEKSPTGRLDEKNATEILFQILQGFKDLISHGYIHRDIKPANTLIKGPYYKLADFGFAAKVDLVGKNLMKEYVGTPLYMAPQLLENHPYSVKSDIWSIGLMFFEMLYGKTPWPARDMNSLINNVRTMPLRFPYDVPVGSYTKSFIEGCLQKEESNRFGWEEVFSHPIFFHSGECSPVTLLDDKAKSILRDIQQQQQLKNVSVQTILGQLNLNKDVCIDRVRFYEILQEFSPKVTSYESDYLYRVIEVNSNADGQGIRGDIFQNIFLEYDFNDVSDKAGNILREVKEVIKYNKIDLHHIFQQNVSHQQGELSYDQYERIFRSFVPGLKERDIRVCFDSFDDDKSGTISFEEFYNHLAYGIDHLDTNYNPYNEKAQKILNSIRQIAREKNMTYQQIFQQFDSDKNEFLDLVEFQKMMNYIDPQLPQRDIMVVFQYFDKKSDGSIELKEFQDVLQ